MQSFGNERVIQQGEEWNLDIRLSQSSLEYIPFIVSSERHNPFLAITVASTKFDKNNRYVKTWWLDIADVPKFYQTVPQNIGERSPGVRISLPNGDLPMEMLYQYTLTTETIDPVLGHKPYHYVYFDEDLNAHYDYEFQVRTTFKSQDTSEWGSQNYLYQITLLDTVSMFDVIKAAYEDYPDLDWPVELDEEDEEWFSNNIVTVFNFIKTQLPTLFQPDIDVDSPVGRIDIPQVILAPTKLQVNTNLRRII